MNIMEKYIHLITNHKLPEGLENLRIKWNGEKDGIEEIEVIIDVDYPSDHYIAKEFVDMIANEYKAQFEYNKDKINVLRNYVVLP